MDKYGINYWLYYETLLGCLRHENMIPWTNDISICINSKDYDQLYNSIQGTHFSLMYVNDKSYDICIKGTNIRIYVINFLHNSEIHYDEVYPLRKGKFCENIYNIPHNPHNFFKRKYGNYDHMNLCRIYNKKLHNKNVHLNTNFNIHECNKIVEEIENNIINHKKTYVNDINKILPIYLNNQSELVLSCVFDLGLDMFLNQLNNILSFNKSIHIVYMIPLLLYEEIKLSGVNIPSNIIFNEKYLDEYLYLQLYSGHNLLLHHMINFNYVKNIIRFEYFGFITQNTYFIKPVDVITSYTFFKLNLDENVWHHESIKKDEKIMFYNKEFNKELYGGQFDGTILRINVVNKLNEIVFDKEILYYPYHEVYIPTLTIEHIKHETNRNAFCKISWGSQYDTVLPKEIEELYNLGIYSAIHISDKIPYDDIRRIYMKTIKESYYNKFSEIMMVLYIINKFDKSEQRLVVRNINFTDYYKNYLNLLKQLTVIDPERITLKEFRKFIKRLSSDHQILVIEDLDNDIIIGTGTLLIEHKLIHNSGLVAHIEDVIIRDNYRDYGLGKLLIECLTQLSRNYGCYKVILNCSDDIVNFYEKCGFIKKDNCMSKYF